MTQTFSTNENNDIYIGTNGNLAIVYGLEAVLQACQTASKALLGEMIYFVNSGVPYFQAVFSGTLSIQQFQTALRNTLLSVSGVVGVTNLTITIDNDILNYSADIISIYGQTFLSGEFTDG